MSDWGWVDSVAIPLVVAAITGLLSGGLITYLVQRSDANRRLRREGYSEAVAALYARHEYPYQVRRRTSDSAESLDRLVELGHENQQRVARALAWVAADNRATAERFRELIEIVQREAGEWTKEAWSKPPIDNPEGMILSGWGPRSIDESVEAFLEALPNGTL